MTAPHVITQQIDGVEFRLAEPADLTFIQRYGRVFRVFDDNDSGNISFGVDDGTRKRFIKLAGANPVQAVSSTADAIAVLRRAERTYRDLAHSNIVRCTGTIEHGPYFGLVFDWVEGGLLRRIHERTFARFRMLPVEERLDAFSAVINTFQHVHNHGYVAVDIYDASFLYDFERKRIIMCDIDVFERTPMVNTMGRMWGSSRFMSPEEFERGAEIDEITNVYTLGAIAFLFFGDERTRTLAEWNAGEALFAVAQQSTRDDRPDRYPGINDFVTAWGQA